MYICCPLPLWKIRSYIIGMLSSNELKRSWERKERMSVVSWHHWWLGMMIGMRVSWCLWNSMFYTYARYLCVHITKHFQPDPQIVLPLEEWDNLPSALLWYKIRFIHAAIRVRTMFRIILIRMPTTYLYLVFSICAIRIISQILSSLYSPSIVFLSLYSIGSFISF